MYASSISQFFGQTFTLNFVYLLFFVLLLPQFEQDFVVLLSQDLVGCGAAEDFSVEQLEHAFTPFALALFVFEQLEQAFSSF